MRMGDTLPDEAEEMEEEFTTPATPTITTVMEDECGGDDDDDDEEDDDEVVGGKGNADSDDSSSSEEEEEREGKKDGDRKEGAEDGGEDCEEEAYFVDSDEEVDQLLEEGLPRSKIIARIAGGGGIVGEGGGDGEEEGGDEVEEGGGEGEGGEEEEFECTQKTITVMEDKSKNSLEVLPADWIEVRHCSGMPLYLHRTTRVCSLAKPYFLGPGSARQHSIPLSAIPCLAYRRQLEEEKKMLNGVPGNAEADITAKDQGQDLITGENGEMEQEKYEEVDATIDSGSKRKCPIDNGIAKKFKLDLEQNGEKDADPTSLTNHVVASGNSEVNLEDPIQSPDRQSLIISREEATGSSNPELAKDTSSVLNNNYQPSGNDSATNPDKIDLRSLPIAKVATAKENHSMSEVSPEELREYCKAVFIFKDVTSKRFKSWSDRRRHTKEQKRIQLQRPTMPDGVKLISFPIHNSGPTDGAKTNKEYIMNPQGKSSVCILHEYVQHALRKQPSYIFKELENAATPYSATVVINEMQYGTGYGSSKKQAKADAAKTALEILIPQMKDQLNNKPETEEGFDILPFFEPCGLFDVGISKICKNFGEPPPYGLLLICLQRNFGQDACNNVKFEMISPGPQSNKFRMVVGENSVEVFAPNKREGKQLASQQLLSLLHPNIQNFGSFVKLYGNNSIKSVKEKKQEEQQITTLQSKASANSPNWAILAKLKAEMLKLQVEPMPAALRQWPSSVKDKQDSPNKSATTVIKVEKHPQKKQRNGEKVTNKQIKK